MFTTALAIFSGPYALLARWVVLGVACLALFGYGWFKGNEHGTERLVKYAAKQASISVKIIARQEAVTERVRTEYVNRVKVIKEKGDEITKMVPVHITVADDTACRIDNDFLRLHNAAAANTVPEATNAADGAASGLKLSQVLGTVTQNYTAYHEVAERLKKLQQWTREQYRATNGVDL